MDDLRQYSDQELSLLVFNDEGLYRMRKHKDFIDILRDYYLFTDDQLNVLKRDLADDEAEDT